MCVGGGGGGGGRGRDPRLSLPLYQSLTSLSLGHENLPSTVILEIEYLNFKFSTKLIFVGGTTWQYKFQFSGKLIFIGGTIRIPMKISRVMVL